MSILLTKEKLEEMGYTDVREYEHPCILINGVATPAMVMHFNSEEEVKEELPLDCPVMVTKNPAFESDHAYSIRLFRKISE